MADVIEQTVTQLEANVATFKARMDPAAADQTIAEAVAKFRAKFESEGLTALVDMAPAQALKAFERQVRGQYDEALRTEAAAVKAALETTAAAMETTLATAAILPDPRVKAWHAAASADLTELRMLRLGQDLDRVERRLTGKTFAMIATWYEQSTDEQDEALVWFVESQARTGWPDVARQPADGDVQSQMRLTRAIEARQLARLEREQPALLALAERLQAVKSSATLDSLLRHLLDDRRGLALVK